MAKKRPAKKKMPLPVGAVWWLGLDQHPLVAALGRVVRRLRDDHGWSLRELAEVTRLSISTLCELEHGLFAPSLDVLLRLEAAFRMAEEGLMRLARRELATPAPALP